jgi:transposase
MEQPIFVRRVSPKQQKQVETGLRSREAYIMRRCQIILASARRARASEIARDLGCSEGTVRNTINGFNQNGLACLKKRASRPKKLRTIVDEAKREHLRVLLHTSPRTWGKETSLWTLELAAEVCVESGVTQQQVSIETIRQALLRLGVNWQRAKHWITSPDPHYVLKKSSATV